MYRSQPYYINQNHHGVGTNQKRINTMIYYLFPRACIQVNPQNVSIQYPSITRSKEKGNQIPIQEIGVSFSLRKYMEEINHVTENLKSWNYQVSHPYSYIVEVSKIKHVSFIFYELLELYHLLNLSWDKSTKMRTLHIGHEANTSIHFCQYIRKHEQNKDENYSVYPVNYTSTTIDYYFQEKKHTMDLVICGASRFSTEYENAVELLTQICLAIISQRRKGTCIIKYGDTFSLLSLDIVALISHFYEKTYFLKPSVCNLSTGEKYIVCKNYLYDDLSEKKYTTLKTLFCSSITKNNLKVERIIHDTIPLFISSKLEEINSIFGQSRLEHIQYLLTHRENWNTEKMKQDGMQKSKEWCAKYI